MDYTVQQLIHNQSFRRMAKGQADGDEVKKWSRWVEANDEHRQIAKQATSEITGFEFGDPKFPDIVSEWERLQQVTTDKRSIRLRVNHRKRDERRWIYRAAAVLLVVVLTGVGFYIHSMGNQPVPQVKQITQSKTITTGANEQVTVAFSDGAKIILNSHSKLTYQRGMLRSRTIKITLRGEAYFEAVEGKAEFAVFTPDGIVKDIGTKFLVSVQSNRSRVVVQDGKVEVDMKSDGDRLPEISVTQGEMLSFDRSHVLNKKLVNPTYYTSWATGFMQFHHTPLRKFAGFIEKRFNVDVKIASPKLKNVKISGSIYFRTLAGLVRSVSKVTMVPAYRSKDGNIVYLGNKHDDSKTSYE